MSVQLMANISQESSSLQVTNVLQKRIKWDKKQLKEETEALLKQRRQIH